MLLPLSCCCCQSSRLLAASYLGFHGWVLGVRPLLRAGFRRASSASDAFSLLLLLLVRLLGRFWLSVMSFC
ncbi:hypothetical protein IWZ03DRAFT_385974 [Phyllosticta citriasiana]|uniref:Uncharacterized protein n=1 Tax=Phyllosticta citriasiana TaxID=595635 RepID=A0ABR1KGE4_9PEZI